LDIQFTIQEPVDVQSNHDLGPCDEENYGQRELIKESDGNETALICSHDNGVYSWKKDAMETESRIFCFKFFEGLHNDNAK
jgi:hypothetical protein